MCVRGSSVCVPPFCSLHVSLVFGQPFRFFGCPIFVYALRLALPCLWQRDIFASTQEKEREREFARARNSKKLRLRGNKTIRELCEVLFYFSLVNYFDSVISWRIKLRKFCLFASHREGINSSSKRKKGKQQKQQQPNIFFIHIWSSYWIRKLKKNRVSKSLVWKISFSFVSILECAIANKTTATTTANAANEKVHWNERERGRERRNC